MCRIHSNMMHFNEIVLPVAQRELVHTIRLHIVSNYIYLFVENKYWKPQAILDVSKEIQLQVNVEETKQIVYWCPVKISAAKGSTEHYNERLGPIKRVKLLTNCATVSFSRSTILHGLNYRPIRTTAFILGFHFLNTSFGHSLRSLEPTVFDAAVQFNINVII
jgi:hypothetical protein